MSSNIFWLTALGSYIVQTKSFSKILGRPIINNNNNKTNKINSINNIHNASNELNDETAIKPIKNLSVQIAIVYFAAWFLLLPLFRCWNLARKTSSMENEELNGSNINLERDDTIPQSKASIIISKLKHFFKILTLSLLISTAVLSYTLALTMTPAFDVTLIQNTAIFEITTLLYGVCSISKRQNVFRNFIFMMIALVGILIVSYANATCDLLAGKLSINKETGEVNDPFLFDRLKAALLCGLGSLTIGPFAVLSNKWLTNEKPAINRRNVCYIALTSICLLIPFIPKKSSFWTDMNSNNESGWLFLILAIVGGILPNIISIIQLNKNSPPEFVTTANLAVIVLMGIVQGLSESNETYIIRWQVIGYIMLTTSAIFLFISLRGKK